MRASVQPMDLNRYRSTLTSERDRLVAAQAVLSQRTDAAWKEAVAAPQEANEVSEQLVESAEVLDELRILNGELQDVAAALGRIDDGSFGRCEECGKPIDEARLEALPTAIRCAEDQRRFETGPVGLSTN